MYKFNNGNGAIVCDKCSVIIEEPATAERGKECALYCDACIRDSTRILEYKKLMDTYATNNSSS